jgi:hypothetical protein
MASAIPSKQLMLEGVRLMKQQLKILTLISIVFTSAIVSAEPQTEKSRLHVDFNSMIENNNSESAKLHESLDQQPVKQVKTDDKGKVMDFIDVEVGVGQAPAMVDRRFDSVGEARTVLIEN